MQSLIGIATITKGVGLGEQSVFTVDDVCSDSVVSVIVVMLL